MKHYRVILVIGILEILIGGTILLTTFWSLLLSSNQRSLNVLIFVIVTACISMLIGTGLLKFKKQAYELLLYFSSVILLTKLLILTNILHLSGDLEASIPLPIKNMVSMIYHAFIIYYLKKEKIKQLFHI